MRIFVEDFVFSSVAAETSVGAAKNEVERTSLSAPVDVDELEHHEEEVTEVVAENSTVPASKQLQGLKWKSRKMTQDQVLEEQYKALLLK